MLMCLSCRFQLPRTLKAEITNVTFMKGPESCAKTLTRRTKHDGLSLVRLDVKEPLSVIIIRDQYRNACLKVLHRLYAC